MSFTPGIHASARIHESASIDPTALIEADVSIGRDVIVGPACVIGAGSRLRDRAIVAGACDEVAAERLVMAITEAVTNAIVHGNFELESELKHRGDGSFARELEKRREDPEYASRVVDIRVDYEPTRCVWTVTDQGRGFDADGLLKQLDVMSPEDEMPFGRGIMIMRAFVDEVSWSQGGRQVRLVVHAERGEEKRLTTRRKYTAAIRVQRPGDLSGIEAIARDLSPTGVAFVTAEPMYEGDAVVVTLDAHMPTAYPVTGRIVRCRAVSEPYHDVAVHFDRNIETFVGALHDPTH